MLEGIYLGYSLHRADSRLIERGYNVRILARINKKNLKSFFRNLILKINQSDFRDWGSDFKGKILKFDNLNDIHFQGSEVVIAVGTDEIESVRNLPENLFRVRFCHGFALDRKEITKRIDRID